MVFVAELDPFDASAAQRPNHLAAIDHRDDLRAELLQPCSRLLQVMAGERDSLSRQHAELARIAQHRPGEHHAGQVVVAEDERLLDRPGGEHHFPGAHFPQPLARAELDHADKTVVVIAERGGAGENLHALHGRRTALIAEDDPRPTFCRRTRRRDPAAAGADDQHIAVRMLVLVLVRIVSIRRDAHASGSADEALVEQPARPHEGLVVEPGR